MKGALDLTSYSRQPSLSILVWSCMFHVQWSAGAQSSTPTILLKQFLGISLQTCALLIGGPAALAGNITISAPFTDDASTGIDAAKAYTHAVSGGSAQTVNGVDFVPLFPSLDPKAQIVVLPFDLFHWFSSTNLSSRTNDFGAWPQGSLIEAAPLLRDFTFASGGPNPGDSQYFELRGLDPGYIYDLRVYIRPFSNTRERPINLTFFNGTESIPFFIKEDRPEEVDPGLARTDAYYISYRYSTQDTTASFSAEVAAGGYGSFHFYALTNEPAEEYEIEIDRDTFSSSITQGQNVGRLRLLQHGVEVVSVFDLGDNDKFQITGGFGTLMYLAAGAFDFSTFPDGTEFSVPILGIHDVDPPIFTEGILTLTLSTDADADRLPDAYEVAVAGNTTDLNGLGVGPGPGPGTGDFDGDTLTDLLEYDLSRGDYPDIDPTDEDSDDDNLSDGEEIAGAGMRPPTDPTDADTDNDGLDDGVESNTETFVDELDTGSDPTVADTDMDGYPDGFEVLNGGDPVDDMTLPGLPDGFSVVVLTTDEDSGISPELTYTHAISGGSAATVNGGSNLRK